MGDKCLFSRVVLHLSILRLFSCSASSVISTSEWSVVDVSSSAVPTPAGDVNATTKAAYVYSTRYVPPYVPPDMGKTNFSLGIYHSLQQIFDVLMNPEFIRYREVQDLLQTYEDHAEYNSGRKYTRTKFRNVFVVIEGLQDTGSRLHGRRITDVLRGHYVVSPPASFQHLRNWFDNQCYQLRSAFYALGNYVIAEKVKRQYYRHPVILNRYWHSQVAIALAKAVVKGYQFPPHESPIYVWPKDLLIPDLVFFVSKRLRLKDFHAMTLRPKMSREYTAMMTEAFLRLREPAVIDVDCGKYGNRPFVAMMQMINATQAELDRLRNRTQILN